MLKILIDANHKKYKIVTLFKDDTELAKEEGDIDIVTSIKKILIQNKLKLEQIGSFDFVQGSESFTGIKMGAAVANVLNWAVKNVPYDKLKMPEYNREPNYTLRPGDKKPDL